MPPLDTSENINTIENIKQWIELPNIENCEKAVRNRSMEIGSYRIGDRQMAADFVSYNAALAIYFSMTEKKKSASYSAVFDSYLAYIHATSNVPIEITRKIFWYKKYNNYEIEWSKNKLKEIINEYLEPAKKEFSKEFSKEFTNTSIKILPMELFQNIVRYLI